MSIPHYGAGGYEVMGAGSLLIDIHGTDCVILVGEIWYTYEKHRSAMFLNMLNSGVLMHIIPASF